jgi:hypothetical protein
MFAFLRVLLCVCFGASSVFAAQLQVGAAQVTINPAPGTPLAGYYSLRPSDGVLDDLHAKALVFEAGGEKAALVVSDLISLPRHVVLKARDLIARESGIAAENVLLAATHTHTAPVVARESPRDEIDGASSDLGRAYTEQLPALLAKSVAEAQAALQPARMRAAKGHVEDLAFNRRYRMKSGIVAWNPPKLDPAIIEPAGPVDPEVGILTFDQAVTAEKNVPEPFATFVNYAMHPDTVGGVRISADYPGALAQALAPVRGGLVVYGNGCCGNINHRNITWSDPQKGPAETARLARILAGAVCAALPHLADISAESVRVRREIVPLPLPEISETDRTQARETVRNIQNAKFLEQVKAFKVLDVLARNGEPWEVEVQVIVLGKDVAFVSLPGEIFVELGLEIKKRSPFAHTCLIELANGSIGYIPNRSAYPEGAYEVVSARCAAGSGEQLAETAVKLLRELKP